MGCFTAPMAEAIITTVAKKVIEKRELKSGKIHIDLHNDESVFESDRFSKKLGILNKMLWGGSVLLAFEHLWHGEVVPFFPFLTAVTNPEDTMEMLHEIATTGVTMALLVTAVWGIMMGAVSFIKKRNLNSKVEVA